MNIYKHKIIISLIATFIAVTTVLLPLSISISMLLSSVIITASFSIIQNYDINYKYWFSFIAQLIVLVFFVASFILTLFFIAGELG